MFFIEVTCCKEIKRVRSTRKSVTSNEDSFCQPWNRALVKVLHNSLISRSCLQLPPLKSAPLLWNDQNLILDSHLWPEAKHSRTLII